MEQLLWTSERIQNVEDIYVNEELKELGSKLRAYVEGAINSRDYLLIKTGITDIKMSLKGKKDIDLGRELLPSLTDLLKLYRGVDGALYATIANDKLPTALMWNLIPMRDTPSTMKEISERCRGRKITTVIEDIGSYFGLDISTWSQEDITATQYTIEGRKILSLNGGTITVHMYDNGSIDYIEYKDADIETQYINSL